MLKSLVELATSGRARRRLRNATLVLRNSRFLDFAPPGHFYSPIPSLEDIQRDDAAIFGTVPRDIPGIDLHEAEQLQLLDTFRRFYQEQPFRAEKVPGLRYCFENPS